MQEQFYDKPKTPRKKGRKNLKHPVDSPTKRCCWCFEVKSRSEFNLDSSRKDGLTYCCKACRVERFRAFRLTEESQRHAQTYRRQNRVKIYEAKKRYWASRPDRLNKVTKANSAVCRALARGELVRPDSCSKCGKQGQIQAAHSDYSRPLDVTWLCVSCHVIWDREVPKP